MIDVRRKEDHYHHERPWLETEWHFSFAEYRDPDNVRFGPLRVVNNDRVDGGRGWGMHSHQDMEIITWVIEGEIVHEDSTGAKERIGRNGVQKMSAGSGISHSEYNGSETDRLHLVQIWIEPDKSGFEPYYQDAKFDESDLKNTLVPVASGREESPVEIEQDATLYVSYLSSDQGIRHFFEEGRRGYLIVLKGSVQLDDAHLDEGDAARITGESEVSVRTKKNAEILLMDLP